MSKLISVIVPCYMVEQYIDRCFNSILNQTIGLDKLELIFVNDASPDHTLEKLLEFEKKYPNDIIVINAEKNLKQGGAKNLGLTYASADYVCFIDSDDWIEPTMLEKLYEKAALYHCDIISCNYKRVSDEKTPMGRSSEKDTYLTIKNEAQRKNFIINIGFGACFSKLYKKDVLIDNNIKFAEFLAYEDNYFAGILSMYIKDIYFIEEYLYNYYINPESTILKANAPHHFDRLITETMKVEEFKTRSFYDQYTDEIEYNFLCGFYINTLLIFFTRFTMMPVNIIDSMKETVLAMFPNYKYNPYLSQLPEIGTSLLKTIEINMTDLDWKRIIYAYRKECK